MKPFQSETFKSALRILPDETPWKLSFLLIFQVLISTLDIAAIVLLGVVTKIGLDYSQKGLADFPNSLQIGQLNFEQNFIAIAMLIISLFTVRTLVSVNGHKKILSFLGNQASIASKQIVKDIFRCQPQYIFSKNSQEILYGVTTGIDILVMSYLGSIVLLATEVLFLFAILTVVIVIQPFTGISACIIFGVTFFYIYKSTSKRASKLSSRIVNLTVLYNQKMLDSLRIYRELVLRSRESFATEEIQVARSESLQIRAKLMFFPTLSKYVFELVLVLGAASMGALQLVMSDSITAISSLVVFLAAATRVLPSVIRAQGLLLSVKQSEGASKITIKQADEIRDNKMKSILSEKHFMEHNEFKPSLRISRVNFTYEDKSEFCLSDISIEIYPGQFVAIVGESGSGKSTLADLALGMLRPNSGEILISNHPPLQAIRKWPGRIGYVPQDITIIEGDIRRNIILEAGENVSDRDIFRVLEKVYLLDDVRKMPNGIRELVGERGMKLSGGQRQRLGIARALFTDPKIIVFDEATSSLDPITENAVTEAIYSKKGDITLIVIAHRLSTVMNADLVVLLEKGKVIGQGTFEEVRRISPKFDQQAKLVNL